MQKLLSVKEAGGLLSVSRSMVYALVNNGTLPHIRIGSRILFGEESLAAWVNEKMNQGGGK